jgi:hypothetical protein
MFNALTALTEDSVRQLQTLQSAHSRLFETLVPPAREASSPTHPALLPAMRMQAYQELFGKLASRQLLGLQGLWSWMLQPRFDYEVLNEALAMQRAILERLAIQQTEWVQGLETLANEMSGIRKVNTLSKLMDQESDIVSQFGALLSGQATAMMELLENVQIGTSYLLARHTDTPQK